MALLTAAVLLVRPLSVKAQNTTFTSGSDGSDGAYAPTTSGNFDPTKFHGSGVANNVFNFTTITIPAGVTITFSANLDNAPVYFLAQGDVDVEGHLVLDGANGISIYQSGTLARVPAAPGSGGYAGGVGGNSSGTQNATSGSGPSGGQAGCSVTSNGGSFTANQYLDPLVGGSGGAGNTTTNAAYPYGSGGGAGGGAILIASSIQIVINGSVQANGGNGGSHDYNCNISGGGGGSGGAIRLISTLISGVGLLSAIGGSGGGGDGAGGAGGTNGEIRLEASTMIFIGSFSGTPTAESNPLQLLLPTAPAASVLVTSVGGTPIAENPFSFPDITINTASSVPVVITAHQVPVGTVPTLYIFSEKADQVIPCAGGLQGTMATSTCTVSITYPYGGSRGFVKANWSQ